MLAIIISKSRNINKGNNGSCPGILCHLLRSVYKIVVKKSQGNIRHVIPRYLLERREILKTARERGIKMRIEFTLFRGVQ